MARVAGCLRVAEEVVVLEELLGTAGDFVEIDVGDGLVGPVSGLVCGELELGLERGDGRLEEAGLMDRQAAMKGAVLDNVEDRPQ